MSKRITVIGAGPGGYTAAFDAAKKGASVTLSKRNGLAAHASTAAAFPQKL